MSLLVVGSIGIDTIETPHGVATDVLGGSATYFAFAAAFFTKVRLVGVVGEDFPVDYLRVLQSRDIDLVGLEKRTGGQTFRWRGRYSPDMNDRETLEVHLNVLGDFQPRLPDSVRNCELVFLANGAPTTQLGVLEKLKRPRLVVADTMDLWVKTQREPLLALFQRLDGLVMNDQEARLLTGDSNLVRAGRAIQNMGPGFVILKKGEHGALFFGRDDVFVLPAFPTAQVVDPTGAGDSFAGGFMGFLAALGDVSPMALKHAVANGIVTASFTVEGFGLDRLAQLDRRAFDGRLTEYRRMMSL